MENMLVAALVSNNINVAINGYNGAVGVGTEIGKLRRVIIHAPDDGIGKIFPLKAQDWLYDDIVDLYNARNNEYCLFLKTLYHFLDPKGLPKFDNIKPVDGLNPGSVNYPHSDNVVDIQNLFTDILDNHEVRAYVVASICSLESVQYLTFLSLLEFPSRQLANTLISGTLPDERMIFPPCPNLMMTRDIAVVINDHILLSRPAKEARKREAVIMRYIVYNHPMFKSFKNRIIDLTDDDAFFLLDEELQDNTRVTMEGGDFLMLSPNHLAIGVSERTSETACKKLMNILFKKKVVGKVTLIHLPAQRYCMHLDTVLTQVKRGMWVVFSPLCSRHPRQGLESSYDKQFRKGIELTIEQFSNKRSQNCAVMSIERKEFDSLEDFLTDVSKTDLKWTGDVHFVMSGNGRFPEAWREQWTDACNVFALKEGVIVTYDRNRVTIEAFRKAGMNIVGVTQLLQNLENKSMTVDDVENTVITLPSSELSRARGGSHCMTQPLFRESFILE